jgi:MtN3 and saliva related transmembrane protein
MFASVRTICKGVDDSFVQIVGIGAGFFTSVSLLPQVFKVYREKRAEQISIAYLITLMTGLGLWVVYGFLRSDIPVIVTNIFSLAVSIVMTVLGLKYKHR